MDVVEEKHALVERRQQAIRLGAIHRSSRRALETVEHACLIPLGLEPSQEPRPRIGEALVVEVDRILRGEHDPKAERAPLLEERHQRGLRRRIRDRREVPMISSM